MRALYRSADRLYSGHMHGQGAYFPPLVFRLLRFHVLGLAGSISRHTGVDKLAETDYRLAGRLRPIEAGIDGTILFGQSMPECNRLTVTLKCCPRLFATI